MAEPERNHFFSACKQVKERDLGQVKIFGTPHSTSGKSPEQLLISEMYKKVQSLSESSSRIDVGGYVSRDELLGIYSKASVALECMKYNLERELAFTTRTIEYLWCGLPVLYNDFSEISGHIADYDAGWAVDPDFAGSRINGGP